MAETDRLARILETLRRFDVDSNDSQIRTQAMDASSSDPKGEAVILTDSDFWWLVNQAEAR